MSLRGARRAANEGLDIIEEIVNATKRSHVPIAENTRIPPGLRQRLIEQATAETQAATQPLIDQLRAQLPALRQAMHREVRSIKGANQYAADQVADVSLKGLHGLARKQLAEELASREAGILASTPLLAAEARQTGREQIGEAKTDIATAQAQQQAGVAKAIAAALSSAQTQIHSRADAQSGDALATLEANTETRAKGHPFQKQVNLALAEARRLLYTYSGQVPQSEPQWQKFAGEVAKAEGIADPHAVQAAIDKIKKMLDRQTGEFAQNINALEGVYPYVSEGTGLIEGVIDRAK